MKVRSASAGPRRRGKPDEVMSPPAPRGEPSKRSGSGSLEPVPGVEKKPTESPGGSSGSGIYLPVPEEPERVERPVPPEGEEDEDDIFRGIERLFEPYEHEEAAEEPQPAPARAPQPAEPAGSEALEPRRIALPLPGQEVSRASPAFQRMLEKLRNEVELYKLHVKHYHMSPAQFRRRTSMLGVPGEFYDKYDRVVTSCKVCSTSVPSPPRARIAGLRASSFGDLIFVDHAEIKYGTSLYLVLLIIDGATNLLWATALTTLEVPETLGAFRLWIEENNCMPKGIVGDQAFFQDMFMDITPYPCGPRTPWPN